MEVKKSKIKKIINATLFAIVAPIVVPVALPFAYVKHIIVLIKGK